MLPRNGFLGLALVINCAHVAHGTEPEAIATPTAEPKSGPIGILVLKNGRVIRGNIRPRSSGGYDVKTDLAMLFISPGDVWILADDVADAHRKMRDAFPQHTPDSHLQLAHWCINQRLYGTAKRELLDALKLDRYRDDIREVLATVTRLQSTAGTPGRRKPNEKEKLQNAMAGSVPPRRGIGNLSDDHAKQFARTIQPLMSRHCSACHQPESGRKFVVLSTRRQTTRETTEHNLHQLLRQIDTDTPNESPILHIGGIRHGDMKTSPFVNRTGKRQWATFSEWVQAVAAEQAGHNQPSPENTATAEGVSESAQSEFDPAEAELLQDAARRNRRDAFNPEIFNTQYRTPDSATTAQTRNP